MAITGIDVSRHQGVVDYNAVKRAGHTFAFIKATEGTSYSYVDWYKTNAPKVRAAGLIFGAYHFLRADRDPAAQARYYVQTVGNFNGVVAILDVETAANGTMPLIQHVRAWVTEFRRLVPNKPLVIYTGRWYWVGHMGNPPGSDLGPLWHSEYETTSAEVADGPELDNYGGWPGCTIWQYTSTGRCPGVAGNCDLNIHHGTIDQLRALANIGEEEDMPTAQEVAAAVWAYKVPNVDPAKGEAPAEAHLRWTNRYAELAYEWSKETNNDVAALPSAVADAVVARLPAGGNSIDFELVKSAVRQAFAEAFSNPV